MCRRLQLEVEVEVTTAELLFQELLDFIVKVLVLFETFRLATLLFWCDRRVLRLKLLLVVLKLHLNLIDAKDAGFRPTNLLVRWFMRRNQLVCRRVITVRLAFVLVGRLAAALCHTSRSLAILTTAPATRTFSVSSVPIMVPFAFISCTFSATFLEPVS